MPAPIAFVMLKRRIKPQSETIIIPQDPLITAFTRIYEPQQAWSVFWGVGLSGNTAGTPRL